MKSMTNLNMETKLVYNELIHIYTHTYAHQRRYDIRLWVNLFNFSKKEERNVAKRYNCFQNS